MYGFSGMNIFNYNNCIIMRNCLQNIWNVYNEEKQIDIKLWNSGVAGKLLLFLMAIEQIHMQ